ncbi:YIP1 family protein [Rubrobacter marinus]|nr:YIP1 family protein [Rubrobacter marinus]
MNVGAVPGPARSPGGDYNLSDPFNSFVDVTRRVVTRPTEFFGRLPRRGDYLSPLVFALICALVSAVLGGLLRFAWADASLGGVRFEAAEASFLGFLASVLFVPIGSTVGLFVLAAVVHLLVVLFAGPQNSGFEATFRVVCYAAVTNLVNWIPLVGGILALYGLYLGVVGVREMHGTTTGRAALVVLLPVAAIALLVLIVLVVAGAFALGRLS